MVEEARRGTLRGPPARSRRLDRDAARDPRRPAPPAPRSRSRRRSAASRFRAAGRAARLPRRPRARPSSIRRPRSAPRCATTLKRDGAPRAISAQACGGCTATIATSPSSRGELRRRRQHVGEQARVQLGGLLGCEGRAQARLHRARARRLREHDQRPAAALQGARDRGATNGQRRYPRGPSLDLERACPAPRAAAGRRRARSRRRSPREPRSSARRPALPAPRPPRRPPARTRPRARAPPAHGSPRRASPSGTRSPGRCNTPWWSRSPARVPPRPAAPPRRARGRSAVFPPRPAGSRARPPPPRAATCPAPARRRASATAAPLPAGTKSWSASSPLTPQAPASTRRARDLEPVGGVRGEPRRLARRVAKTALVAGPSSARRSQPGLASERRTSSAMMNLPSVASSGATACCSVSSQKAPSRSSTWTIRDDATDPRQQQRVAARALAAGGEPGDVVREHAVQPAHAVGALDHDQAARAPGERAPRPRRQRSACSPAFIGPGPSGSPGPSAGAP